MSIAGRIVLIEDHAPSREIMKKTLEKVGHTVTEFASGHEGIDYLRQGYEVDVVITDLMMPGMDGMAVLKEAKGIDAAVGVVVVTGHGTVESAVEAMKAGADDFIQKPVNTVELRKRVEAGIQKRHLIREVEELKGRLDEKYRFGNILGQSKAMKELYAQLQLVAPTRSSVLITGESGTGKELIANALHQNSPRRNARFLPVNCAAIPADILESEMFGHEKGSFTGATGRKIGKFELADKGTLFLDEVGEIAPEIQVKLLRVLEEKSFMRVGGSDTISVDVRIIAATNASLEQRVAEGRFRSDLYYRLKVVTLHIPPLRERREDIPILVKHFLDRFARDNNREGLALSPEALRCMVNARWEGNVRELRNLNESLVVMATRPIIDVWDLPEIYRQTTSPEGASEAPGLGEAPRPRTMEDIEREAILRTLKETEGNRTRAAEILGIGLRTLQRKLKDYGEPVDS
ncbi:MAG TPA: sigma-54 dependent transcriptional regulator [Candidatus Polarisedimenticolia bacterium]|nr:sigma-54 dependent transcriptional regulator [Candidatus Polarisedimenticolia bacterium]